MYAYQSTPFHHPQPGSHFYPQHPPPHPTLAIPPKTNAYKAFPSPSTSGDSPNKTSARTKTSGRPSTSGSGATRDPSMEDGEGSGSEDEAATKLEIRREKNRVKQRNLRMRRANHVADLESALNQLQTECNAVKDQLATAQKREAQLEDWIRDLEHQLGQHGFSSEVDALRYRHVRAETIVQPSKRAKRSKRDPLSTLAQAAAASAVPIIPQVAVPPPTRSYTHPPMEHMLPPTHPPLPHAPHSAPLPHNHAHITPPVPPMPMPASQFRHAELDKKRKRDTDGPLVPPQLWAGPAPGMLAPMHHVPQAPPQQQPQPQLNANAGSPSNLRIESLLSPQVPPQGDPNWDAPPPLAPEQTWQPGPTDIIPFHPVNYPLPSPSPPNAALALAPPHPSVLTARSLLLHLFPTPLPYPLPPIPSMAAGHQQIVLIALSQLSPPHVTASYKARQFHDLSPAHCKLILEYESSPFPDPRLMLFPVIVLKAKMIQLVRDDPTFDLTAFINSMFQHAVILGDPNDNDAWEMSDVFWDLWQHYVPLGRAYCHSLRSWRRRDGHMGATVGEMLLNLEADGARRKDGPVGRPPTWRWEDLLRGSAVISP